MPWKNMELSNGLNISSLCDIGCIHEKCKVYCKNMLTLSGGAPGSDHNNKVPS